MTQISTYEVGDRVGMHPATDWWARGARYGTVVKVGRKYYHVRLDYGRTVKVSACNLVPQV